MPGLRLTLVRFTVFAVVSVILFVGLFRLMSNHTDGESRTWTARFANVSGLRAGDDVRVAGVKVGRVDAIEVADNAEAAVRFTIRADQPVYEGTRVTLRYQNLLGQRYLALTASGGPGGPGPRLDPGAELPISSTNPGFDLTELLNGFEPLFAVLEPAEVNRLASNLVAVLQGESGTVESLLRNIAGATDYLAGRDRILGAVLDNLTPVLEDVGARSSQLDTTVVQLRELMAGLAGERATFARSIDNLGDLVDTTSGLLQELRAPVRRDIGSLRATTGLLARERERLSTTLDLLPEAVAGFARTMSYGNLLNVYLCNLGVSVLDLTTWVGGGSGPYSKACR